MKVFTREVQDKIQAASEAVIAAAAADGVKLQNFSMGCSVVDHTWVACSAYALPDEHRCQRCKPQRRLNRSRCGPGRSPNR